MLSWPNSKLNNHFNSWSTLTWTMNTTKDWQSKKWNPDCEIIIRLLIALLLANILQLRVLAIAARLPFPWFHSLCSNTDKGCRHLVELTKDSGRNVSTRTWITEPKNLVQRKISNISTTKTEAYSFNKNGKSGWNNGPIN